MFEIWPSLISADILDLKSVIHRFDPLCAGYHIDIMDNQFVPNLTWGAQFANAIAAQTKKPLWIHLMILSPEKFLDKLILPQGTYITFHAETKSDIHALIKKIKQKDWRPSMAVNPETAVEATFPFLEQLDQILIMSVNPGFSGQELIPHTLEKISLLKQALYTHKLNIPIAVDGGITRNNIAKIHELGAEQFGIASGIFACDNPVEELKYLNTLQ
jgi:ribulose-phosphate 3-epimerase